jgi:hypothetical protein
VAADDEDLEQETDDGVGEGAEHDPGASQSPAGPGRLPSVARQQADLVGVNRTPGPQPETGARTNDRRGGHRGGSDQGVDESERHGRGSWRSDGPSGQMSHANGWDRDGRSWDEVSPGSGHRAGRTRFGETWPSGPGRRPAGGQAMRTVEVTPVVLRHRPRDRATGLTGIYGQTDR